MYAIACGYEDCDDPEISFKTLEKGVSSMAINLTSQKSSEEQCLGGSSTVENA